VSDTENNIVVRALLTEHRRELSRLDGATKRLDHANKQLWIEGAIVKECTQNLLALEDAIIAAGGVLPKLEDGEEPYTDGEAPQLQA
jgi:hypothetical protein